ncbi:MAG: HlyD family type I secretion periplasmic adaptor subunit [Acidobacteria bacterium]|nr:MAG: HlyD family type I secretion periplasmic adaptor subunit [Acidobacteriota bacterium]
MTARALATREWYADVPRHTYLPTSAGVTAIVLFLLGFGYWSSTALIAGAVITSGAFVTTGQNKIIQHLEGGVIREILVREGDVVEAGETVVLLDPTGPKAELDRLILRHMRAEAMEARLIAEIQDKPKVTFPPTLVAKHDDPDIQSIVGAQLLTFDARRKNLEADLAALKDSIGAIQERISAAQTQKKAVERQVELITEELTSKSALLPGGLVRKPELLALQRAQAALHGEIGKLEGEIGEAKEQIAKTTEQMVSMRAAAVKEAVEQLHQARAEIADVRERMRSQQGILDRVNITAPVRGIVVKLRYHTTGGVIEPGKNIMEILPLRESLIIEVRVRPQDIDHVKVGQEASIRLTALNQRTTPTLVGKVAYVSADALPDDLQTVQGREVYVVRVQLAEQQPPPMQNFKPKPGMPAEVYIKTTERTFFEYLMQPIRDSMSRAFRES